MEANIMVILSSVLINILAFSTDLTAQEKSELDLGARVRVSASKYFLKASKGPINVRRELRPIGTVQFFGSDTLIIETEDSEQILVIPKNHLRKLEISHGHKSQLRKGCSLGL